MAISAQTILNQAAAITGMKTTGSERVWALACLNTTIRDVRRRVKFDVSAVNYTFTSTTDWYDVSAVCGGVVPADIVNVNLQSGGGVMALPKKSTSQILSQRLTSNDTGIPIMFGFLGTGKIGFFPNPGVGDVAKTIFVPKTADAADATAALTQIDDEWLEKVLLPGTVSRMYSRDAKLQEKLTWMQEYESVVGEMINWVDMFGGDYSPIMVGEKSYDNPYPDYRSRGM